MDNYRWLLILFPLLMAMGLEDEEEEEGGMGGTGHTMEVITDIPDSPELPELMDSLPIDMDVIELDDAAGGEVDMEVPECDHDG